MASPQQRDPNRPPRPRPQDKRRPSRRPGYVAPEGRTIAAGRAFLITLLAFAIWLGVDARQLYDSANNGPLGVRRSVAMSLLRPVARVEEFFGADRVVDGANRALGRSPVPVSVAVAVPQHHETRHRRGGGPTVLTTTTTTTLPVTFPQPTAADPLTVLDVGDSIGEDLGYGLQDVIGSTKAVSVKQAAVGDTGLADIAYYDWPAKLAALLAEDHPQVVVVLMGGNDWQAFIADGREAVPGTAFWRQQYGARVEGIVNQVTSAGARLFWVGLPVMASSGALGGNIAPSLNDVYQSVCNANPNCDYLSIYKLFENSKGQYSAYLPNASGSLVEVRDPDGVHLAPPAGNDLAAGYVVSAIDATLAIKL